MIIPDYMKVNEWVEFVWYFLKNEQKCEMIFDKRITANNCLIRGCVYHRLHRDNRLYSCHQMYFETRDPRSNARPAPDHTEPAKIEPAWSAKQPDTPQMRSASGRKRKNSDRTFVFQNKAKCHVDRIVPKNYNKIAIERNSFDRNPTFVTIFMTL